MPHNPPPNSPPPPEDLEATRLPSTRTVGPTAGPSHSIGPYRLLQKIGEGGMGEVWQAEQTEPVRRRVAIKVIKEGMDTKQVIARFEAERQALAMMDHPRVAKVLDAGSTAEGHPFFVMEYVSGVPITEHCDRHNLTTLERLDLFMQVCDGVQHAHHKAIIHRDLKPSNVLVSIQDGTAVPKIIDFGVAKATAQQLTERTLFTELGVLIGTPEYMSPEQAELTGQDVDTRTDVYSLGVMLYELLVGALPFEAKALREAGFDGIRRKIREEEPSKPSTRLVTLGDAASTESARRRRVDVPTLRRQLAGDLDWITMKALEKDRARRYGSPAELAADLKRHVRHEPVLARRPSTAYRAQKFVRRHRFGVAAAAIGLMGLIGFAVAMAVQARRTAREAEAKRRVAEVLTELFQVSDPSEGRGNSITARELLDRGASTIRGTLTDDPAVRAELMMTVGKVYRNLGLYTQAEPLLEEALEIRRRALGDEDPETLRLATENGSLYFLQGRNKEAEALHRETLGVLKRVLGPEHPDTLKSASHLAVVHHAQGRYKEAEALHRETLDIRRRVLGPEHPDTLKSMNGLAAAYYAQGRYKEAETLNRETLEIRKRVLGPEHPHTLASMTNLANAYRAQGRHKEAETLDRETLDILKRVLGPEHPDTLASMSGLANAYRAQGRFEEAETLNGETLDILKRVLGPEHPDTLKSMNGLARTYSAQGRFREAEALDRETLDIRKRVLGPEHPDTLRSIYNVGCLAALQGKRSEALRYLRDAVEHGYSNAKWMLADSDLVSLRGDAEFERIVVAARENQERAARTR